MREIILTPKFKRAFRKFVNRNNRLQNHIEETLKLMHNDLFTPELGTHKLSGELLGLYACICGYDCRIVFSIEHNKETMNEMIILLDIGTHDEVY
ncbi:MAG: type II toxin-antitoxin system mRNA interferase toxin, RelE/StbE family [Desulfamplus sp.]|nr:type II toxin-antitoxin system mRNA interferase toxin, RelE/StbE family [Desulfamplus sp.]